MTIWAQWSIFDGPRVRSRQGHLNSLTYGYRHRRMAVDHCMLPEKDGFARGVCSDHVHRERSSGIVASRGIASFKGSHLLSRVSGTPPRTWFESNTPSDRLFWCSRMGVLIITGGASVSFFAYQVQKAIRLVLIGGPDHRTDAWASRVMEVATGWLGQKRVLEERSSEFCTS